MFTGIVQTKAKINAIERREQFLRLELSVASKYLQQLEIGASIAINGCCLTVVAFDQGQAEPELTDQERTGQGTVSFDVIDETLRLTNLGGLVPGSTVNFERSLTMGRELGGHIVSGHIHTTATVGQRVDTPDNCRMFLRVEESWMEYILSKGFVAVDGASLTVGEADENGFWLHLIPETLQATTLGDAKVSDKLNIEVDQQTMTIVETVKRVMAARQ